MTGYGMNNFVTVDYSRSQKLWNFQISEKRIVPEEKNW
jgi:hypothetical protein